MLHTTLGNARLLARPADRRLWLLAAGPAALWDLHAAGWAPAPLAELLTVRFGLAPDAAQAYLYELHAQWQAVGLLAEGTTAGRPFAPIEPVPSLPPPVAALPPPGAWHLSLADRAVSLAVADAALHARLAPLLASLMGTRPTLTGDQLVVQGEAAHWTLTGNGVDLETGQGLDAAEVAIMTTLTEWGCRPRERLLVVHGAGLVAPDGRGLLLIAPGGSGKSTLAAALNAAGYGLLSDDVVPVTPAGALLGLGLPLCLKAGSWPVLAGLRPELANAPAVLRGGQTVRFLPPHGRPATGPLAPALLVFPRYRPGHRPYRESLSPEQALQGLVEAEAVIRDLDQAKLEALARWVSAVPAAAVAYPDLASGLALVQGLVEDLALRATA